MAAPTFEPNEQRQNDIKKIVEFIDTLADGQTVSWLEFEQHTSVVMNDRGRELVRLAAARRSRPYLAIAGSGIEFSSALNAEQIVDGKKIRIVRALEHARVTTDQVIGRHLGEMPDDARKRLTQTQATLATLALSVELARKPALPEPKATSPGKAGVK